jgi:peptidoglycan-associated lipoprotein
MKKFGEIAKLLAFVVFLGSLNVSAQQDVAEKVHFGFPSLAVTYEIERAKIANSDCGCFWLQGSSAEVAVPFYSRLSLVGSFAGLHASNIQPEVDVSRLMWVAGPRFSNLGPRFGALRGSGKSSGLFGQVMGGGAHAFDGAFPNGSGLKPSANSYAIEAGGGLDIALKHRIGLRAIEIDYVRTAFPNSASDSQNGLRVAFGFTYAFKCSDRY